MSYNTILALVGAILLGALCGSVGSFTVLRRRSLVGDVIAHSALMGIVLAFLITGSKALPVLLIGALISGILGSTLLVWIQNNTKTKPDGALVIVLATLFGFGIVLSRLAQNSPHSAAQAGLDSFLLGKLAGIVLQDVLSILVVAVIALVTIALNYKELKVSTFDPEFFGAMGGNPRAFDFLAQVLLTTAVVAAIPMAGVVLVAALTILPAITARFWTHRCGVMVILASVLGAVGGASGVLLSSTAEGMPSGPIIIIVSGVFFTISLVFSPIRGVIAAARTRRLQIQQVVQRIEERARV